LDVAFGWIYVPESGAQNATGACQNGHQCANSSESSGRVVPQLHRAFPIATCRLDLKPRRVFWCGANIIAEITLDKRAISNVTSITTIFRNYHAVFTALQHDFHE
jgi:hypothetical protein